MTYGVAAIILAAGGSQRIEAENKLLLPILGVPMITHVSLSVKDAGYDPVLVITGHEEDQIRLALDKEDVEFVRNESWKTGISSSIKKGISVLPQDLHGCLIVLGDMPLVSVETCRRLKQTFEKNEGEKIVFPSVDKHQGNPVLFPRKYFGEIMSITGDKGCKSILMRHPEDTVPLTVTSDEVLLDCDTQEDYLRLLEIAGKD